MTPTPLTDYHTFSCDPKYSRPSVDYVDASFCKSLERALAAAQAELAARSSITQALSEGRIASFTIDRTTLATSLGKVRIVVELDVI